MLRALLRDKVHVRPGTLARLPTSKARALPSPLALGRLLLQPMSRCPIPFLRLWASHPRGHGVISPNQHGYQPGPQAVGRRILDGVAWIAASQLLDQALLAAPVAHLLDHLLGCDGDPEGPWLSDGAGRDSAWHEVGQRLQRQFVLGYGPGQAAIDPHAYFAWGLQTYLADRPSLNVADPGLERLLRDTLLSPAFWGLP